MCPAGAVVRDNELWFYYIGINQYAFISSGAVPGYDDYYPDRGAICLAVLRPAMGLFPWMGTSPEVRCRMNPTALESNRLRQRRGCCHPQGTLGSRVNRLAANQNDTRRQFFWTGRRLAVNPDISHIFHHDGGPFIRLLRWKL